MPGAAPPPSLRFSAAWNGTPIVGVSRVTGLRRTVDVIEFRAGTATGAATTQKVPGDVTFEPVTLERAVTGDETFATLADAAASAGSGAAVNGTLTVALHDRSGQQLLDATLHRAWVSAYDVFTELGAGSTGPVLERITVVFESWTLEHTPPP